MNQSQNSFSIRDFGAIGDGVADDTKAITDAIKKSDKNNGGTIVVPAGKFLTGPIRLKSNVNLHLEKDALVIFNDDFASWPAIKSRWEGVECFGYSPCIYGENLTNVSITGAGTIDGSGQAWWKEFKRRKASGQTKPESARDKEFDKLNKDTDLSDCGGGGIGSFFFRPPLLQFNNCSNVLLDGIIIRNSPFWNTHLLYCTKVTVKNMTFQNPPDGINGDGLNIDSCDGVEGIDCNFDVNDDCLCIKSGIGKDGMRVNKPCRNIVIKRCKMLRGHGSVVIGSETAGNIRDIEISDCVFNGTDRGLRIKSRRGRAGTVENITINNITMTGVGCPVVMNLYYECGARPQEFAALSDRNPRPITETTPCIRNIKITNVTAENAQSAAAFLLGLPERPIENILFENVKITLDKDAKPGRPAMAFGVKEMQGKEIIAEFVKDFVQRNVLIKK
ncbi:MAG: glycoside hydrolase family 28 protein [Sedimentisphaerales bacterium]|nr:glycoside hydrolase family 28 protein [Sedimentisphaerales bacterium]